ncbi:MAG: MFS transporter [Oleiphilus sp.]|nr:MAG: MFS transporter [Oleiphilus sp.]
MSQSSLFKSRRFLPFFLTQFLGAFNDNIFKNTLMLLIAYSAISQLEMDINVVLNLAAGLFILPFFLFSGIAGQITDISEKSRLMRRIKLAEILIMLLAAAGFLLQQYFYLLGILFLMGTQSTFFGPAKYAILPQHLKDTELVGGNAIVEMGTFVAILLGTIGAGLIMQFDARITIVSVTVIGLSILGYLASRSIPLAPAGSDAIKISFNPLSSSIELVKTVRKNRAIYLAIMAISWFWFLGAAYLTQFPNFSIASLNGDASLVTLLLALFTVGIGLGSMMCESLSRSCIELGIVPVGALGLSVFGIDLYFAVPSMPAEQISWSQFLSDSGNWRLLFDLTAVGLFGGIFIVPLYAYVQARSEESYRARTIAVINIMNALFMVGSAIAGIIFLGVLELSIPDFFLVLAIMNLVVCAYVFYQVDEFALRFVIWLLTHMMYRVRSYQLNHIPEQGAAVIVCNHVSYVDALLIAGASPRPVRFVMDHQIFKSRFLGWFFRLAKAIPIAPEFKDKQVFTRAFDSISEALDSEELVCIFPEGKLTRSGKMNEFRTGIEKILQRNPVPVIPLSLTGLWGSVFSHRGGPAFTRLPKRFWSKVSIDAGEAVKPESATAELLYQRVFELHSRRKQNCG